VPIERRPLRDDVYRELCDRIVQGELIPGSRVRDAAMAELLGVSRTPVREAMLRLTHEGLLESDVGRGFTVRPLTPDEVHQATGIVAALECLALRETDVFPDARLRELDDINARLIDCNDPHRAVQIDHEWHDALVSGCGDHALRSIVDPMRESVRRYTVALLRDGGQRSFATDQHLIVTDALRNGDLPRAESILGAHWHDCRHELAQWLNSRDTMTLH